MYFTDSKKKKATSGCFFIFLNCAFEVCPLLTNVNIPDSVTVIEDGTFRYCDSLTSIIIPAGVTHICDDAFLACRALQNVTFNGSVEQWNAINKGADWNILCAFESVKCSDGTVNV